MRATAADLLLAVANPGAAVVVRVCRDDVVARFTHGNDLQQFAFGGVHDRDVAFEVEEVNLAVGTGGGSFVFRTG